MKPSPLRSLATHLVGVAAGGALAYVLIAMPPDQANPLPPKHRSTTLAARFSPTVTLELEHLIGEIESERLAASPEQPPTIRETILRRLEKQPLIDRTNERELQRLRTLAGTFVAARDLAHVLTDALATGDLDLARALFLEWHRRDPGAAFDALAQRRVWLDAIDDTLAFAIPNQQLITQIANDERPDSFRDHLAATLGTKLGATDDLGDLVKALEHITTQRRTLLDGFTRSWIPDNGTEAARFIGLDMKPGHQEVLLDALAGYGSHLDPQPWTDDFAKALFDYDLHVPQGTYERLVSNAKNRNETAYVSKHPVLPPVTGIDPEQAVDAMALALDAPLHTRRDYPELFAADAIDMDEIIEMAKAETPGAKQHPEALKCALFLKLAPHNPARAITWANTTISRAELDRAIGAFMDQAATRDPWPVESGPDDPSIWSSGHEPRTRRIAELATVLQPSQIPDAENGSFAPELLMRFNEWSRLAPDAAKTSIDRITPDHPIWKFEIPETAGP